METITISRAEYVLLQKARQKLDMLSGVINDEDHDLPVVDISESSADVRNRDNDLIHSPA